MDKKQTLNELKEFYISLVEPIDAEIERLEKEFDKVVEENRDIDIRYEGTITIPYARRLYHLRMSKLEHTRIFMENKQRIMGSSL